MAKITTAWVWIYPHASQYKEMTFDEVKRFCKEHGYMISKNGQIFDVDDYTFSAEVEPLRQYCFTVGHYERPPHIDLVPCGTTIADGRYVFPKENKQ
jgi:hypothetical protein